MLQVSFGQLLPSMPPKTTSSWEILCLQQALGSSGGTSLAEMRYCTLVLVMAPCFCRRWSRSWLLWRKCRLHFSHCGETGKETGCETPCQGTRPPLAGHQRPQDTAPTIQVCGGKSGNTVGGAAPGTPHLSFQQHILVYGMHKGQSPSGDDSGFDRYSTKLHI